MREGPPRATVLSAYILNFTVALAPLPFGSTDRVTVAVWAVVLGIALLLALPAELSRSRLVFLACSLVLAAAWALVLYEQLSTKPWPAAGLANGVWAETSRLLDSPIKASVSVARNQPYFAAGAQIVVFVALVCGYLIGHYRTLAQRLVATFAWSGLVYAIFGIFSFAIDPTKILWRDKEAYQGVLTSTFINRNTAAVYFGCCAIVWLSMLLRSLPSESGRSGKLLRQILSNLLDRPSTRTLTAFFGFFVVLSAMFMTGSRAGSLLSIAALVAFFMTFFRAMLSSRRAFATALLLAVAIGLVTVEIMGSGVSSRVELRGLADSGRWEAYKSTVAIIRDYPWLGTGLGTFALIFPSYRSPDISAWGIWDRAHNTLLELAAELGIPFTGLLALCWLLMLAILAMGVAGRKRGKTLAMVALFIALLAICHSLVDFSLQITGFAVVVMAIIGTGLASAVRNQKRLIYSNFRPRIWN